VSGLICRGKDGHRQMTDRQMPGILVGTNKKHLQSRNK
jgi:hypothetical protein